MFRLGVGWATLYYVVCLKVTSLNDLTVSRDFGGRWVTNGSRRIREVCSLLGARQITFDSLTVILTRGPPETKRANSVISDGMRSARWIRRRP